MIVSVASASDFKPFSAVLAHQTLRCIQGSGETIDSALGRAYDYIDTVALEVWYIIVAAVLLLWPPVNLLTTRHSLCESSRALAHNHLATPHDHPQFPSSPLHCSLNPSCTHHQQSPYHIRHRDHTTISLAPTWSASFSTTAWPMTSRPTASSAMASRY